MYLYSGSVMFKLIFLNSGVCWYLLNSSSQACWLRGGTDPLMGFHSVIERPERVRRTKPPKTTRNATMKAKEKSQFITARLGVCGMYSSPELVAGIISARSRCEGSAFLPEAISS